VRVRPRHVSAVVATVVAAAAVHRVGRRSGVSGAEVAALLPGDGIVSRPTWSSTRGTTIATPRADVWPWIVQMGYPAFRAGWYTPHWLDRLQWGIREDSAHEIRPDLQDLVVGDRVPDSPDCSVFFTVAELEPERHLVLHSTRHVLPPVRGADFSWAFCLAPAGDEETRLLIRARVRCEPRWAGAVVEPVIGIGDFLNAEAMLRGIRSRAESDH
jgi:hypothetical protein